MPMNKYHTIAALAVLVALGAGFWGGMTYARSGARNMLTQGGRGNFQNLVGMGGQGRFGEQSQARNGGGFTAGEIIKNDGTSITVKLQDGGSKIVFFSASTAIMKSVTGTSSDLVTGQNIVVVGTANSDGSISAESIQLRPAGPTPAPQQ